MFAPRSTPYWASSTNVLNVVFMKAAAAHPGWSACWSARWWCVCWGCWGPSAWPERCQPSRVWWKSWKTEIQKWYKTSIWWQPSWFLMWQHSFQLGPLFLLIPLRFSHTPNGSHYPAYFSSYQDYTTEQHFKSPLLSAVEGKKSLEDHK